MLSSGCQMLCRIRRCPLGSSLQAWRSTLASEVSLNCKLYSLPLPQSCKAIWREHEVASKLRTRKNRRNAKHQTILLIRDIFSLNFTCHIVNSEQMLNTCKVLHIHKPDTVVCFIPFPSPNSSTFRVMQIHAYLRKRQTENSQTPGCI